MARPDSLIDPHEAKHVAVLLRKAALNKKRAQMFGYVRRGTISVARARWMLRRGNVSVPNPHAGKTPPVKRHNPVYPHARAQSRAQPQEFERNFLLPGYEDVVKLAHELGLPVRIVLPNRSTCHGIDALLVWLRRVSSTDTVGKIRCSAPFNVAGARWSESKFSHVFKWVNNWLDRVHGSRVAWSAACMTAAEAQRCVAALQRKGCLIANCMG